jgi:tetratricopeptide (TPR) repeat protein
MRSRLPSALAGCVKRDRRYARFDLSRCTADAASLLALAARVQDASPLDSELLKEIEAVLPHAGGIFLPQWEEVVETAAGASKEASEVVSEARQKVADAHRRLLLALAEFYLADGQPDRALPHLEEADRRWRDRQEIGLKLVDTYERAGMHGSAERLRERLGGHRAS